MYVILAEGGGGECVNLSFQDYKIKIIKFFILIICKVIVNV